MTTHLVKDLLGTADGKCRDQDIAAAVVRRSEDLPQFGQGLLAIPVPPVAVGAFHQHHVGFFDGFGIAQNGRVVLPQVSGEDDLALPPAFLHPDLHRAGAENVPGVAKAHPDTIGDIEDFPVLPTLHLAHHALAIRHGVQRLDAFAQLATAVLGAAFLQVGRIGQQYGRKLAAGLLRVDGSAKTPLDQQG